MNIIKNIEIHLFDIYIYIYSIVLTEMTSQSNVASGSKSEIRDAIHFKKKSSTILCWSLIRQGEPSDVNVTTQSSMIIFHITYVAR
jgi:hypothetical protein